MPVKTARSGLTGNQLKILAMIAMTCDHAGLQLFPQLELLRIIGRLALPIYGFMIAEGCRHSHDRRRYFLRLAGMALLCQTVYWAAEKSLYQCILVTFSLSVVLICALDRLLRRQDLSSGALALAALGAVYVLCQQLPRILPGFEIDYGLAGVLLPVLVYFGQTKYHQAAGLLIGLLALAQVYGGSQWYALAAVPILAAYNGRRGTARLGGLFYWYYPLHLAVIYLISLVLPR